MTLYQIWDLVSYIAGKFPSGGAIPPARFNLLVPQVQDELTQRLLDEVIAASVNQTILDKILTTTPLIPFKKTELIPVDWVGVAKIPLDYNRYIAVYTSADYANNTGVPRVRKVDMVSDDLYARKRGDIFSRAHVTPFAKINSSGIAIVPFDAKEISMDYFRKPAVPYMDWCQSADNPNQVVFMPVGSKINSVLNVNYLYDKNNVILSWNVVKADMNALPWFSRTIELEWDAQYHEKFVYLILAKCGINLNEGDVVKYAMEMGK